MYDEDFVKSLPDDQQEILENFRKDLKENPVRKLNKREKEIYGNAIFNAQRILPSFRDAFAVLSPYMDSTCSTAYTDRNARVGLSYWFFYLADKDTRTLAIIHEAMHVLNSHFARAETIRIKPDMMNYAGDFEINTNLSTIKAPDFETVIDENGFLEPEKYSLPKNKTMEQYVSLLNDKLDEIKENSGTEENSSDSSDVIGKNQQDELGESDQGSGQSDQGGDSSQGGDSQSNSDNNSSNGQGNGSSDEGNGEPSNSGGESPSKSYEDYVERLKGNAPSSNHQHNIRDMFNSDGSDGSESKNKPIEDNESSVGKINKNNSGSGQKKINVKKPARTCDEPTVSRSNAADRAGVEKASDIEQTIARENTRARVVEELNSGSSRGYGSNDEFLRLSVEMMKPPKIDWRHILRTVMNRAYSSSMIGRSHTSYKRVNRRYTQGSVIFPGTVDYAPKVLFGIDTSGSMGNEDYANVLPEIESIIKGAAKQKDGLKVFSVDTNIKNVEPVSSVEKINLFGGGGTDMSVAFQYANNLKKSETPQITVLATDGWTDWNAVIDELSHAPYISVILVTQKESYNRVPEQLKTMSNVIDISD